MVSDVFEREKRGCFDYFWFETNNDESSPGHGITRDQSGNPGNDKSDFGSIAATGFALCAYIIGVEKQYVSYEDAKQRTLGTLNTFYHNVANYHGFFHHFLHLKTAGRWDKCEVSDIDTALFIAGAITAGEYFGGEIKTLAEAIYERIDWNAFVDQATQQFVMGYHDETGFIKHNWNHYAEQLIMCILGAGSPTFPSSGETLYSFERLKAEYGGYNYIRTRHNALFIHQFSHAFIDFKETLDRENIDWFQNSVNASLGHWLYCKNNPKGMKTFSDKSWGLSACHYKHGYSGAFGAEPCCPDANILIDGTVAPYAALGSLPFTPKQSLEALNHYGELPELWGKYGLVDSYNLDEDPPFYNTTFLGIDKGITIVMMANYENGLIWEYFMKNKYVSKGMEVCEVKKTPSS